MVYGTECSTTAGHHTLPVLNNNKQRRGSLEILEFHREPYVCYDKRLFKEHSKSFRRHNYALDFNRHSARLSSHVVLARTHRNKKKTPTSPVSLLQQPRVFSSSSYWEQKSSIASGIKNGGWDGVATALLAPADATRRGKLPPVILYRRLKCTWILTGMPLTFCEVGYNIKVSSISYLPGRKEGWHKATALQQ